MVLASCHGCFPNVSLVSPSVDAPGDKGLLGSAGPVPAPGRCIFCRIYCSKLYHLPSWSLGRALGTVPLVATKLDFSVTQKAGQESD